MVTIIETFHISETLVKIIKNQALISENEIYGWLIGYQKDKIFFMNVSDLSNNHL